MLIAFSSLEKEKNTRVVRFGDRADRPQRQQKIDPGDQVKEKSANVKELLLLWQSRFLSSGKNNSQNMSTSELPKTESPTINQLKDVSVTGILPDHRLKRTHSMNSLLGSNQHESTSSRFYLK